ncbi:hypothetical protein [Microbacterium sp. 2FI]|uniref:hypothetical protein n=1 Tax=Microbacterium sp. 2FI TaxID=2502193 RepID=UPI0010F48AFA|nr:hypothetical protein [Microbacterium sp. 2FI]
MTAEEDIRQIVADQRELADRLEQVLADNQWMAELVEGAAWPVFDPETDEPAVRPDINGNRAQLNWVTIVLWSKLAVVNVREGRGATREEYIQFSKDAGYRDGRGWNAWDGYEDREDGRWIAGGGVRHLAVYYERERRSIPADILDWAAANGVTP